MDRMADMNVRGVGREDLRALRMREKAHDERGDGVDMGGDCELILSLDVGGSIMFWYLFSLIFVSLLCFGLLDYSIQCRFLCFFFLHKLLFSQALLQSVCLATFSLDSFARSPEMNE